jgi:hypothetical protein
MAGEIAPHVLQTEYCCQHCGKLPPDLVKGPQGFYPIPYEILFESYADIRRGWGRPIHLFGYRCPEHELQVSGKDVTVHVFGLALDLGLADHELDQLDPLVNLVIERRPELRIGTNRRPGFIHVHIDVGYLITPRYSLVLVPGARWEE